MSIQFAGNEKVFRAYDYASLGIKKNASRSDTFKSLVVTNKRLIHEEICTRRGHALTVRQEMPVEDAKYINTALAKTSKPALLVWCVIFALLGAVCAVLYSMKLLENVMEGMSMVFLAAAAVMFVIAVILLASYFGSRKTLIALTVSTDHDLYPIFGIALQSSNGDKNDDGKKQKKAKKNNTPSLEIRIDGAVAQQMVDELGAVIQDALAYDPASEIAETEEAVEAAEAVEAVAEEAAVEATEEVVEEAVEAPAAEEAADAPAEEATENAENA